MATASANAEHPEARDMSGYSIKSARSVDCPTDMADFYLSVGTGFVRPPATGRTLVCFDLECTGLSTATEGVAEFCLIYLGNTLSDFVCVHSLCNPQRAFSRGASRITGLNSTMVRTLPSFPVSFKRAYQLLMDVLGLDFVLVGWNNRKFDDLFLKRLLNFPFRTVDAYPIYKYVTTRGYIRPASYRLSHIYLLVTGNRLEQAHGALADTAALCVILLRNRDVLEQCRTDPFKEYCPACPRLTPRPISREDLPLPPPSSTSTEASTIIYPAPHPPHTLERSRPLRDWKGDFIQLQRTKRKASHLPPLPGTKHQRPLTSWLNPKRPRGD